jgi:hypothetical protein
MHAQDGPGRVKRRCAAAAAVGALAALGASAPAQAVIVPEYDPDAVAQAIVHDPATLNAATTDWQELATPVPVPTPPPTGPHVPFPAAVSSAALGGFPTSPASFAILTTGDVAIVDTPNDAGDEGEGLLEDPPDSDFSDRSDNGPLHGDTDNDVTVLKLGVTVPAGMNCVSLDYRFLSDEFPEFVGSQFNDAFVAEIDPPGGAPAWSTSGSVISHVGDFATAPSGEPVSINGVGGVAATVEEAFGTTFDGATGRVTTKNPITPGPHLIFLSIFDQGDEVWDAAVMLDRLAFLNESPATCKPPEVPVIVPPPPAPPAPPGPPAPPPPPNDFTVPGGSVTFRNGSATITVNVPGPGVVTASQAPAGSASRATAAAAKKKKLIKPARVVAKKAGPVKLKIKPTKAGKKVLRNKKKLKVRLAITFTPTGGSPRTEVSRLTIKVKKKRH